VNLDSQTSAAVARRVRAQFRRCWRNAALAVSHLGPNANYVEGWVVTNGSQPFVIEHGWCEADGGIVDPSYTPYVSTHRPPVAYFAGMRFNAKEAAAAIERRNLPIVWSRTDDDHDRAFEAAWCHVAQRSYSEPWAPTRVVHCRREPYDVFVGRPSAWASPFFIGRDGTRQEVIEKFRRWFIRQPSALREVARLRGLVLGCDCKPLPCHGDIIAELADLPLSGLLEATGRQVAPGERRTQASPSAGHSSSAFSAGTDL
jgi:hypothetical protein